MEEKTRPNEGTARSPSPKTSGVEQVKTTESVSRKELYEMIRGQVEHEDNLVNQRLNWLLASQAFLFAAFTAFITNKDIDTSVLLSRDSASWILLGITFIGLLFNGTSFIGIRAAYKSLRSLRQTWYSPYSSEDERQKLNEGFPQITWVGRNSERAINTASATPMLIALMWGGLALAVQNGLNFLISILAVVLVVVIIRETFRS